MLKAANPLAFVWEQKARGEMGKPWLFQSPAFCCHFAQIRGHLLGSGVDSQLTEGNGVGGGGGGRTRYVGGVGMFEG